MSTLARRIACLDSLAAFSLRLAGLESLALVGRRWAAVEALRGPVARRIPAREALARTLGRRVSGQEALCVNTHVARRIRAVESMFAPAVEFLPAVSATIDGAAVPLVSCAITSNEDSYSLAAEIELADAAAWARCVVGAALVVAVGSDVYQFLIDTRSRTRVFDQIEYKAQARSRASRLDAPYAATITKTWTNATARAIAQELCAAYGVALDWRICDWVIPTFDAAKQTPLMNEIKMFQRLLGLSDAPVQLGAVTEVLDSARVVVKLDVGGWRQVKGQADPGARVAVQADQLLRVVSEAATVCIA